VIDVMVVDDEHYVRLSIINRMDWSALGLNTPLQAENGLQALELLRQKPVQILITDVRMPGMDGLKLIDTVCELYPDKGIQFIVLSGYAEFEYARSALRLGAADYLLKPVDTDELTRVLKACIEKIPASSNDEDARIASIKTYINTHLDGNLKLDAIAKEFYISSSYLSALFRAKVGQSLTNYIKNARLLRAKTLLETTDIPISEIARMTGYNDQTYFSKVFKRVFGIPPKKYQQKHR
jgi:two-component system response regulator YesN